MILVLIPLILAGRKWGGQHGGMGAECKLHPLIHTLPPKNQAQSVVDSSKYQKCGLKYVMFTLGRALRILPLVSKTSVILFLTLQRSSFP